jgi:hypothetical protein
MNLPGTLPNVKNMIGETRGVYSSQYTLEEKYANGDEK